MAEQTYDYGAGKQFEPPDHDEYRRELQEREARELAERANRSARSRSRTAAPATSPTATSTSGSMAVQTGAAAATRTAPTQPPADEPDVRRPPAELLRRQGRRRGPRHPRRRRRDAEGDPGGAAEARPAVDRAGLA